jgi:hypothetical protein
MHVPDAAIMPIFVAAFMLSIWQYYVANPEKRVSDRRFLLAAAALAAALLYLVLRAFYPDVAFGPVFLGAAAVLLGCSLMMLRRNGRRAG